MDYTFYHFNILKQLNISLKFVKTLQIMHKPLILVVNDDGIEFPGIRKLISIMNEFGDVVVVASGLSTIWEGT